MGKIIKWICTGIGVALVAVAVIYIMQHFDQIMAILPIEKIKDFFSVLWGKICMFVDKLWFHIKNW